jgi:hypothetical protein
VDKGEIHMFDNDYVGRLLMEAETAADLGAEILLEGDFEAASQAFTQAQVNLDFASAGVDLVRSRREFKEINEAVTYFRGLRTGLMS